MDKAALLAPRGLKTEQVPLPQGGTVTVRGLNRLESIHVGEANDRAELERRLLSIAMVDPELTLAEVGEWQKVASGGEIEAVSEVIARLSGLMPDADKAAYKSDGDRPGSGV